MKRHLLGIVVLLTAFLITVSAQEPTEVDPQPIPNPKPTPTPKRRTFDQFDLSNGVRLASPSMSSGVVINETQPVITEIVDGHSFDDIMQLIEYSAAAEYEYRSSSSHNIDPAYNYSPERVLQKKLTATYRILEVHRSGLFGQRPLKKEQNLTLLKQNQEIINDMMAVMALVTQEKGPYSGRFKILADRYLTTSHETPVADNRDVEKRELLYAMFTRLNTNFARLKNQIVRAN